MVGRRQTRVVVAEDDPVFAEFLKSTLEADPSVTVVAVARDGEAAVSMVEAHDPEMIILDLQMPHVDGVEATRRLRAAGCRTPILVVTGYGDAHASRAASAAGATAFLLKDGDLGELMDVFRTLVPLTTLLGRLSGAAAPGA